MPCQSFDPSRAVEILTPKYGSGYRISSRLVLTAKHLFPNGAGIRCKVRAKTTFGEKDATVLWVAPQADIALVELPDGMKPCDPVVFGRLPAQPSATTIPFDVYGWPKWAQTMRSGKRPNAGGRHIRGTIYLADSSSEDGLVVLEPARLPKDPLPDANTSEWTGLSGAVIVCNGLVVAVQCQHQNPGRAASLEATSLATVYDDEAWRALMQQHGLATGPKNVVQPQEESGEDVRAQAIVIITSKLKDLSAPLQKKVAEEIRQLAGGKASGIHPTDEESRTQQTAMCIVSYNPVADVIVCLIGLMLEAEPEQAGKLADIVDVILPLNYVPDVIQALRQQVNEHRFGLVENEATTWTLAEIIMAGYDQKAAEFKLLANGTVRGQTAVDFENGPEVGPGNVGDDTSAVLLAAKDVLFDMLARLDATPPNTGDSNIGRVVAFYSRRLNGVLTAERNMHPRKRAIYYVLKLPNESAEREFLRKVLSLVCREVPRLVFLELASFEKHEQESEVERYIQRIQKEVRARLLRPQ